MAGKFLNGVRRIPVTQIAPHRSRQVIQWVQLLEGSTRSLLRERNTSPIKP